MAEFLACKESSCIVAIHASCNVAIKLFQSSCTVAFHASKKNKGALFCTEWIDGRVCLKHAESLAID